MLWKCGFIFVENQFPWMSFGFFQRNELFIEIQYPVNQCINGINVLMVSMITNSHILDSHIYTELMPSSANETTICSVVLFAIISTFQIVDT